MSRLQDEIQQSRPFATLEEELLLNIARTADMITQQLEAALKPASLSPTQYNVLRILRGAAAAGRSCGEIAERMITRDPDITRLLDRLEARGLVSRCREQRDRRVVLTRITPDGLRLLEELDRPLNLLQQRLFAHLPPDQLRTLISLLEVVREERSTH